MTRKSSKARKGRAVSALVRAEDAAEEEILEMPAFIPAIANTSDVVSDMAKVKDKLIYEQKKTTAVKERKKSQAHRRVAKEAQSDRTKARIQEAKDACEVVKLLNELNKHGCTRDYEDRVLDLLLSGKRKHAGSGQDGGSKKPRTNKAREAKNAKFGFGGKRPSCEK